MVRSTTCPRGWCKAARSFAVARGRNPTATRARGGLKLNAERLVTRNAGAVVPPQMTVPPGVLVLGQPGKVIRELKPGERDSITTQVKELRAKAKRYLAEQP